MTGLGRLRATTEARESGHEKSSPTARVLINKIDRNYEGGANELLDDLTKMEKRLIQRVDLSEGETSGPRTPWTPPAPPPYSVIVTPATPQTPLPSRANATALAAQPLNPKAFCLADQAPFYLAGKEGSPRASDRSLKSANMNLADINLSKIKPSSKTKTSKQQPVTSGGHGPGGQRTTTTTTRSNDGLIECTSLDFYMTDRTHQTAACSSTEKQVRFSMTTIRTPPSSPKPRPVPSTNPLVRKSPRGETPRDIETRLLERLEVLPESQA